MHFHNIARACCGGNAVSLQSFYPADVYPESISSIRQGPTVPAPSEKQYSGPCFDRVSPEAFNHTLSSARRFPEPFSPTSTKLPMLSTVTLF